MWKSIVGAVISPVTELVKNHQKRKLVQEEVKGKLAEAKLKGNQEITFKDQELEHILASQKNQSLMDEYATISVLSVFNIIVVGGIAAAFGYPTVLTGVIEAVNALHAIGVNVGFLMETVVFAAVGLSVWRKWNKM